ncbi:MAG: RNA-binding transcriptional accessory protein [Armatimonadetes bacterium]|nr:RNA-binding transcriptional accessory protein [Armatimonadota bacterium]
MNEAHISRIAEELSLRANQVRATADLLSEGATVPFISRYRKEATDSLDEVAVAAIRDRLEQLAELDSRREAILKSLEERELLTDDLRDRLNAAETLAVLEDIYLPYRPKRRTRATIARERGLEPLADLIFAQGDIDIVAEALAFVDPDKEVNDVEEALAGARDIIAERVNEDEIARATMRRLFAEKATLRSRVIPGKEEEGAKYRDYFEWEENLAQAPSHRVLAMRRGEDEGILSLRVSPPEEQALAMLRSQFVTGEGAASEQVRLAVEDSYKRLLSLSMETEARMESKRRADEEAIQVFAGNLRQLLLAPPLGQKAVLALDPGFRTGCKLVCLDRQGKLLYNDTIFVTQSDRQRQVAAEMVRALCERHGVEAIAIGNGTASRETESFVRSLDLPESIACVMVDESGASIYSASEVAREEFPEHDVTVRGSVSIGRRLMDPLAELVKIDPKSIGVGQYQHDVDQAALRKALDDVVISCVNAVGVEVNTASKQLLSYVSGLGPKLAQAIVDYRNENGAFSSRRDLLKVPRLGPKAFEQCAGFLRIRDGENPLDASAVHPESYPIVERMAKDLGCDIRELMRDPEIRSRIKLDDYVTETFGMPTLQDILQELAKPGRDPRERFEAFQYADGIEQLEDLQPGMTLPGIVTNITKFGVFVDVGVHQDGLVHISQLADHFVKDPNDVVKLRQHVKVKVLEVDLERGRIALTMRANPEAPVGKPAPEKRTAQESRSAPRQGGNSFGGRKSDRREKPQKPERGPDTALGKALLDALKKGG